MSSSSRMIPWRLLHPPGNAPHRPILNIIARRDRTRGAWRSAKQGPLRVSLLGTSGRYAATRSLLPVSTSLRTTRCRVRPR